MKLLPETRERVEKAIKGEAEAVPILAQMNEHVVTLCGGTMREAYTDAKRLVEMNLALFEYYRLDLPGFYYDLYNIEAEALGQRLTWEADRMPDIDRRMPLIREPADLDRLRPPDCRRAARMPFVLDVMRRVYDLGLPVRLRFCSPFSLAANVRGIENLLMDILTAPRFAHRLLTFLTDEVLIPWVQTQRDAIGQPGIRANGADAAASPPIVTVEILDEFVMPYAARMNEQIGNVSSMGYWGYSHLSRHPEKFRKMLDLMASVSPGNLMCQDPDVAATGPEPYAAFARERRLPLTLGLGASLLQDGPLPRIVAQCRRYVTAGARAEPLVIFFSEVTSATAPRNVQTAIAAIRHFGRLPVQDRPLESFHAPEAEPFDSFLARTRAL
jgi:uroporphyrinogen-III decarboxylase